MSNYGVGEDDAIVLVCGAGRALVRRLGAECRAWRARGLDLIWTPDPAIWAASSPILFPIVGRLRHGRMKIGERSSPMGIHGFAAASRFEVEKIAKSRARFTLADDCSSRAIFPFRFELSIDYQLSEEALRVSLALRNPGQNPMPYACGLHPGFRWPFDGGATNDYRIEFERAPSPLVPEITSEGLFGRKSRLVPLQDQTLSLSRALFAREALCFLGVESRVFRFVAPSGRAIRLESENFPHFALWSWPPGAFLCLESWTGHGDPADFDGEVFAKPSMRTLEPGATAHHEARYSLE